MELIYLCLIVAVNCFDNAVDLSYGTNDFLSSIPTILSTTIRSMGIVTTSSLDISLDINNICEDRDYKRVKDDKLPLRIFKFIMKPGKNIMIIHDGYFNIWKASVNEYAKSITLYTTINYNSMLMLIKISNNYNLLFKKDFNNNIWEQFKYKSLPFLLEQMIQKQSDTYYHLNLSKFIFICIIIIII